MILIWGFRARFKTVEQLVFFCPQCGADRNGARRVARRWFTLFWIPLIPLKELGEVVECGTCKAQFRPEVTQRATSAALGQALAAANRAVSAMLVKLAEPGPGAGALRAAAVAHVAASTPGYDAATLEADVATVDERLAEQYVAPLVAEVTVPGREQVLVDLCRVAAAGGPLSSWQRTLLERVGAGLGLTPHHVGGVLSSMTTTAPAPHDQPPA